jgi:tetratricopeptide (TPR) repeat protein
VAQQRGAYDEALDYYRRSLQIKEELGDRSGMALSFGQMAVLLAKQDRFEAAVPYTLRSLGIHVQLQSPNVQIDLHWLRRQREQLGDERFREILTEHLDADTLAAVWKLLESMPPAST